MTGGFTLVEMLVVVVLLALSAAIGAVGLAGTSETARAHSSVAALLDLDRKARLFAQSGTRARLVRSSPIDMTLESAAHSDRTVLAQRRLEMDVELGADGVTVESVEYDLLGRSVDYTASMRTRTHSVEIKFAGLTGWAGVERSNAP